MPWAAPDFCSACANPSAAAMVISVWKSMLCRASVAEIHRVATMSPAMRKADKTIGKLEMGSVAINSTSPRRRMTDNTDRSCRTGRDSTTLLTR